MTDHDDSDTGVAPTEQAHPFAAAQLPPAEPVGTPEALPPDDTAEVGSAPPPNWYVRAGLLTLVTVVVGVAVIMPSATTLFRSGTSKHTAAGGNPSTTVPVKAPPSASAVAPSAVPAATPTPGFSAHDEKFLSLMSQEGWGCAENSSSEQCRKQIVGFAHQICSYSGQPVETIYQNFDLPSLLGPGEKRLAIVNAEQSYPNCTFTGTP